MSCSDEEWKPVIGYEGRYEISSAGRVKRIAKGKGVKRPILNPGVAKVGYRMVTLSQGTIASRQKHYVHSLVAEAFIGPYPDGCVVNHKDANKLNNHPSNLEYISQPENVAHAWNLGLFRKGEELHRAKLTDDDVREIRAVKGYMTTRKLGELYGVNGSVICHIQHRKRWTHVT